LDQIEEKEQEQDQGPQQGHDDYPADQEEDSEEGSDESSSSTDETESSSQEDVESSDSSEDAEQGEPTLEELKEELERISSQPEHQPDADVSETDEAFRSKEETLIDKGENGEGFTIMNELRPYHIKNSVIGYKDLEKARNETARRLEIDVDPTEEDFKKYVKETKRSVNFAVKEFEQRKAAFRYTRATTAKSGRLDVNKLWSYKTSEDIFSQVTTLADAKSHGMIMLVDFSGSMSSSMPYVMDQLLHMVHFCKAINIPFDVYGFTTNNSAFSYERD
jgi:hypothetical protein